MRSPASILPRRSRQANGLSSQITRYALGALTLGGSASLAHADFSGDYALTPPDPAVIPLATSQTFGTWTSSFQEFETSNAALDDTGAPADFTLESTGSNPSFNENFTNTAAIAGTLSFTYNLTGSNTSLGYLTNGSYTGLSGSGTVNNVTLTAGESFGFEFQGYSTGSVTISNFSAPQNVPEPATTGWLAAGALGLLTARAARRRRVTAG